MKKPLKFKQFQKQDYARAAMHDGLILAHDTGLGKTLAAYTWPLLKCGYHTVDSRSVRWTIPPIIPTRGEQFLTPKKPVLLIVPGDLHHQTALEGIEKFNIPTVPITCQDDFVRLTKSSSRASRQLPNGFFVTSYTQLTINNVNRMPDAMDCDDPVALMDILGLAHGEHVPVDELERGEWKDRPDFATTCDFFAWRGVKWADEFSRLAVDPLDNITTLVKAHEREIKSVHQRNIQDIGLRDEMINKLNEAFAILKNLMCNRPEHHFHWLSPEQQTFIVRHFLDDKLRRYEQSVGEQRVYHKDAEGDWELSASKEVDGEWKKREEETVPSQTLKIECIYSPSLADLCYDSFDCVCIDEAVKIKGEDTYVGMGVRKMDPKYRLVLSATPVKNRLPDIFRLAYWATGGNADATARWPYRDDSEERNKFAETFMVSERNVTKEEKSNANGGKGASSGRYKRLTAEVCNIHRLWKLFGPIVLRRRKDDCGEAIVPKIRKVIRCEMGSIQKKVYEFHLRASYLEKDGKTKAVGAQLQALRMAAAAPDSTHLTEKPGHTDEKCQCTMKPVPPEEQVKRLVAERDVILKYPHQYGGGDCKKDTDEAKEGRRRLEAIEKQLEKPLPAFDHIAPRKNCVQCQGTGDIPLPFRSGQAYIPKMAAVLELVQEILERKEQVVIGSAFNDPLDSLSRWLTEADVRHIKLDGRVSQKKRAVHAAKFKKGRHRHDESDGDSPQGVPVMLAGVECMAEGHSFHLANNVILLCYSWAYDKFIQFINRVHRMTSEKPVNVYVIVCHGTIDLRLESLIQDKGDAAELVLDGRLIGEHTEEINLAELLNIAHKEFDHESLTIDEAIIQSQWPDLRDKLRAAAKAWHPETIQPFNDATIRQPMKQRPTKPQKIEPLQPATHTVATTPLTQSKRTEILNAPILTAPTAASAASDWREKLKARVAAIQKNQTFTHDAFRNL
jgi:hypothetical protein